MSDSKKTAPPTKAVPAKKGGAKAGQTAQAKKAAAKNPPAKQAKKRVPAPPPMPEAPPAAEERAPGPFRAEEFRRGPRTGLGTPGERLFTGLAWFGGALYLATTARKPDGVSRVHRRLPTGDWATVYESPPQPLGDGTSMTRDYGISMLKVLQAPGDAAPCLYVGTMSILGGLVLRSEDGESFERASPPGLGDDTRLAVTDMVVMGERLFALTRGTITDAAHEERWSPSPVIHMQVPATEEGADPVWTEACLPGFGDLSNLEITTMTVAHDALYATTLNPTHGFQLWRSKAEGDAPFDWEQVLTRGAWRYALNMEVTAAAAFGDRLWLGTGLPGQGHDITLNTGPGAGELIAVDAEGGWEVIMGEMRFSPDGLKVPQTTMGPGFHNDFNAAVAALLVQDGVLYASTRSWEPEYVVSLPVEEGERPPPLTGGAELWYSADGADWQKIDSGAAADTAAIGMSHLAAAPGTGLALTLDLSGRAVARKSGLWTGFTFADVPPDDETEVVLAGVPVAAPPPPLSLDLGDGQEGADEAEAGAAGDADGGPDDGPDDGGAE